MKKSLHAVLDGVSILTAIVVLLFVYAPIEFFINNHYELWCSYYDILKYMIPVSIVVLLIGTFGILLIRRIHVKMYKFCVYILFAAFLILYVEGTFLSGSLPPLDGRAINWADYDSHRYVSICLCIAVSALVFFLYSRVSGKTVMKIVRYTGITMTLILLFSALLLTCSSKIYKEKEIVTPSESYLLDVSKEDNLIIILVDAVDGERFQKVMECHPDYLNIFKDFTSYTNVMSGYPYTSHAIPLILGGKWFENESSLSEFCTEMFKTSPLFKELKNRNYRMAFYDPDFSYVDFLSEMFENISDTYEVMYPDKLVKMNLMMAGFRYFPYDLKKICVLTPDDFYIDTIKTTGLDQFYSVNNVDFLSRLEEKTVVYSEQNCFKFIYVRGAHEPFSYESVSEKIEDYSYESSIEMAMTVVSAYLDKLKLANVFDNSAIVIMADHGYVEDDVAFGRQNPFLLIKGKNEKHEFGTCDVPISHIDMQDAFLKLLDGTASIDLFAQQKQLKDRRFIFFNFGKEEIMWEYLQHGHASDENTMEETGNQYILKS